MRDTSPPQEPVSDEIVRLRNRLTSIEADYRQADKLLRIMEGDDGQQPRSSLTERFKAVLDNSSSIPHDSTFALRAAEQASRMSLLTDVSTKMNLAKTEADVFRIAAHFTPLVVPSQRASVARLVPGGVTVEVFALEGQAGIVPLGAELPLVNTLIGEALREQRLVMTPDTRDVEYLDASALLESGLLSIINVPMIASGQPIQIVRFLGLCFTDKYGQSSTSAMVLVLTESPVFRR